MDPLYILVQRWRRWTNLPSRFDLTSEDACKEGIISEPDELTFKARDWIT